LPGDQDPGLGLEPDYRTRVVRSLCFGKTIGAEPARGDFGFQLEQVVWHGF
jgi:hypothetical protein